MSRILFVCYGNICRSPMAQGMFAKKAKERGLDFELDSAGVSNWHEGEPPDKRAQAACAQYGIDISKQRSRPIVREDFNLYDFILAMDRSNLIALEQQQKRGSASRDSAVKIELFLSYAKGLDLDEVPDPYHDSVQGFVKVLEMIEKASEGLLNYLGR